MTDKILWGIFIGVCLLIGAMAVPVFQDGFESGKLDLRQAVKRTTGYDIKPDPVFELTEYREHPDYRDGVKGYPLRYKGKERMDCRDVIRWHLSDKTESYVERTLRIACLDPRKKNQSSFVSGHQFFWRTELKLML